MINIKSFNANRKFYRKHHQLYQVRLHQCQLDQDCKCKHNCPKCHELFNKTNPTKLKTLRDRFRFHRCQYPYHKHLRFRHCHCLLDQNSTKTKFNFSQSFNYQISQECLDSCLVCTSDGNTLSRHQGNRPSLCHLHI